MVGKILHEFGVAAAEQDGVADQRGLEAGDDVEDRLSPACFAAPFEADETDVLLVRAAVLVREMSEFEGDDGAVVTDGLGGVVLEVCAAAGNRKAANAALNNVVLVIFIFMVPFSFFLL